VCEPRLRKGHRQRCGAQLPRKGTVGNANFAWMQHFIDHLAPHGYARFALANGSLSSQQ
jgi:type I restriction enzyme M protein